MSAIQGESSCMVVQPQTWKLDPRWEGGWTVSDAKGESTVKILEDSIRKVVHMNCLPIRVGAQETTSPMEIQKPKRVLWQLSTIDHPIVMEDILHLA